MDKMKLAMAVYIMSLIGYLLPAVKIVGIVFAYLYRGKDHYEGASSHFTYQIWTCGLGMLYFSLAYLVHALFNSIPHKPIEELLTVIYIFGAITLLIWDLSRNIRGICRLRRELPINHPKAWLW